MIRVTRAAVAAATVGLLAFAATACDSDGEKLTTQPKTPGVVTAPALPGDPGTEPVEAAATAQSTAPPQPAPAKVGDTITINGANEGNRLDATVVKIVDPAATGNEFSTPKPGYRFVAVQWRIANTGVRSIDVGPMSGSAVIDADGQQFGASYQETTAGPLYPSSATIPAGSSRLGFVMYELPSASTIQEIQFDPSMGMGSQVGQWTVS